MDQAVVPAKTDALAFAGPRPDGFGNMTVDDLVTPTVKLYHPMAKYEVDGIKIGHYADVTGKKNLGDTIKFFPLAQKTVVIDGEDDNGQPKQFVYKHVLVALEGQYVLPKEIIYSAAAITEVKSLITSIVSESIAKGGVPLFTWLVKSGTKVIDGKKSKYAVPQFATEREATAEELAKLKVLYDRHAESFLTRQAHVEVDAADVIDVAPAAAAVGAKPVEEAFA